MKNFNLILAVDKNNWLWKNWKLAWNLSKDLLYFKKTTVLTKISENLNALIMWRKTWESIPEKYRPLPWRLNIVLTRNTDFKDKWCVSFTSFDEIFSHLDKLNNIEEVFVIGWANIYNQVLNYPNLERIYLTKINNDFWCDVFFNWIPKDFILESESNELEENWVMFKFLVYKKLF